MRLKQLWQNKNKIIEGIYNTWFPTKYVKTIAARRLEICKRNVCGYYDPKGENAACIVKGKGCCSGCGCNDIWKTHSLSSTCYLQNIGLTPLWEAEMTEKEEEEFRKRTKLTNEH